MSPLEFISFLDEEIDEQVPVAVTRFISESFQRLFQSRFTLFHSNSIPIPTDLFYNCLSDLYPSFFIIFDGFLLLIGSNGSHCHLVFQGLPGDHPESGRTSSRSSTAGTSEVGQRLAVAMLL